MQTSAIGAANTNSYNYRFNERVFEDARKDVRKSEVRDADWGLLAAQTCLAKDLVTADEQQTQLIKDKMNFINKQMNDNLNVDSLILTTANDGKCKKYAAKADAKAQLYPGRIELLRAGTDSAMNLVNGATDVMKNLPINVDATEVPELAEAAKHLALEA